MSGAFFIVGGIIFSVYVYFTIWNINTSARKNREENYPNKVDMMDMDGHGNYGRFPTETNRMKRRSKKKSKEMKKVLLIIGFLMATNLSFGQMVSVTAGNLNFMNIDRGYLEVEVMQPIVKNIHAHVSYTNSMAGPDIIMVGSGIGLLKQRVGVMLSACFMENHKTMGMWGIDIKPIKGSPVRIIYSQSTDNDLKQIGLKVPLFNKHH